MHRVAETPVSTFSVDVDTGSYANVRRFLNQGSLPPEGAVRLEEMVNYFPYSYALPTDGSPFGVTTEVAATPWNPRTQLLRIGIKASDRAVADLAPANLVFLVDVSGSMDRREGLPLVKSTLKVLVDQLTGALYPITDNVKIQVEWNPAAVAEYRLIGYETRALNREDFNNDKVDAGDIGAGTQVTAIYEITPPGSPALLNDPLRYGTAPATGDSKELGFLRLRSVAPGQTQSTLLETPITLETAAPTDDAKFAVAIAGFGQKLRGDTRLGRWSYTDIARLARPVTARDPMREQFLTLVDRAAQLQSGGRDQE